MIHSNDLPVSDACRCLDISRGSYYKWMNNRDIPYRERQIKSAIHDIALEYPKYGYRRITAQLRRDGLTINHKKVLKIMKEENILCKPKKKFRVITTDSNHALPVYPNLAKDMAVTGLNQLWVADITYVHLGAGHVYLSVIIDVFSRKCVGWELDRRINTGLVIGALGMALKDRLWLGIDGLIHHSDQGVQYASEEYVDMLNDKGIRISMSRKGNPYDNAFAESFMKTLKAEEVYMKEYRTFEEAYDNIRQFIEEVYNKKRLHSSIGYRPPEEFENEVLNTGLFAN